MFQIIAYILSFFLLTGFSSIQLENFLKPIEKTGEYHSIHNVDFIYMINLDRRPEKYALCLEQLAPYGIVPFRFSAVDGWSLSLQAINEMGVTYKPWMKQGLMGTCYLLEDEGIPHHEQIEIPGRNYFCHCLSRGAIGIVLSHLSILKDAFESGYNTIWVMEDDIEVIRNPHNISDLIAKLDRLVGKDGWDLLFTDQDTKNQSGAYVPCRSFAPRPDFSPKDPGRFARRKKVGKSFRKIGARYGAYSMIVRRSGMQKILDFYSRHGIFLPYDMDCFMPVLRIYTVVDDIVSTLPNALSNNGAP